MKLHELLSHYETAIERGESLTPEEVCRDHPELLDQFRQHARAIRGIRPPLANGDIVATSYADEQSTRFTVLRPHARGGLGEVYLARDGNLGRDVALKVMLGPGDAQRRSRFEREAAITGKLQHPGIVPVYGTGTDNLGRPCHVMRFVSGPTLAEAIDAFHSAAPSLTRTSVKLRQLLARLTQVAQTIAFAHSCEIVHRDLKPSNVILGDYGETLVVDWGLAKDLRAAEDGARSDAMPDAVEFTQDGTLLGTPAFLSPEQARGEEVTLATDVFALGGLLYCVLGGTAPYAGCDAAERHRRSSAGDVPPLSTRVPLALQAIVRKAMAPRPGERFTTALEFAAELDRWLADEPLASIADPLSVRVRRWTRRHRIIMTSGLAALVVAAVSLAVATGLLSSKNRDLGEAVSRAETKEREATASAELAAKREAEALANFQTACDSVDKFTLQVNDDPRLQTPQLQKLRTQLLTSATEFYRTLADRRGISSPLRARIANAQEKLGVIKFENGDFAGAERDFRFALDLNEQDPDRDNRYFRLARASNHFWLSEVHRARQKPDDCQTAMQASYDLTRLARQDLSAADDRFELIDIEVRLAFAMFEAKGMTPEVMSVYDRAMTMAEESVSASPNEPRAWSVPPAILLQYGSMHEKLRRRADAEKAYSGALTWHTRRAASVPDPSGVMALNHVRVCTRLVNLYRSSPQRAAECESIFNQGLTSAKRLLQDAPGNPEYQQAHTELLAVRDGK